MDSGFERLCAGETAINDASRRIDPDERELCAEDNIIPEQIQVASEALVVIVNSKNPVDCVTVDQLAQIWGEDAVSSWDEVEDLGARASSFDPAIERFGPGTGATTFDFFTEAVNDEEGEQTRDYEDVGDEQGRTVDGVRESDGGIGYLDFSSRRGRLRGVKALEIENGAGKCVAPTRGNVQVGSYRPLGRALYMYVAYDEAIKQPIRSFLPFYMERVGELSRRLELVPMSASQAHASEQTVARITGADAARAGTEPRHAR